MPYRTLRARTNAVCEASHIYLTAIARFAQWTGVYALCLDALARSGALTILTGMTTAMRNLAVRPHAFVSYAQNQILSNRVSAHTCPHIALH